MEKETLLITEEETPDGIKLTIRGRINSENADELQDKLQKILNAGKKNIVLNMLWVSFLSSAGIRVILKTYQSAIDAGGKFGIEMPSKNVRNVLGMTALDKILIQ